MDLLLEGRHALLFDDDATSSFVNSPEALVPWSGDASLLIDRYDVRHLLDRIPRRIHQPLFEILSGVSQSELDQERYLDLPPPDEDDDGRDGVGDFVSGLVPRLKVNIFPKAETIKRSEATHGDGTYQAVSFSYGNINTVPDSKDSASGLNSCGFHPPFPVPESLLCNLPPTEKLHQIIARTATFVSKHGGQSEIVLRVKQGDNPTFGFLMPDHHLHAYFRYLVDHPQLLKVETISSTVQEEISGDQGNESHLAASGALSLLGSVYGSGEDDDIPLQDGPKEEMEPGKSNIIENTANFHRSEKQESSISRALEDEEVTKDPIPKAEMGKPFLSKRKCSVSAASISAVDCKNVKSVKNSLQGVMDMPQSSHTSISEVKPLVLEPPSSLKETMDKIVEFILRNGKEFEAILIEQDKTTGRFPFLLPSNQYHSFYIKLLDDALESKRLGKIPSDQKHDNQGHLGSKKSSAHGSNLAEEPEGWFYDPHKREKFKMTIGGPKINTHGQHPAPARNSGASMDEAAAIVRAATRGSSPADTLQNILKDDQGTAHSLSQRPPPRKSGASTDEAAAIIRAATRGVSPANVQQNISRDASCSRGDSGRASIFGSFLKPSSVSEAGIPSALDLSGSTRKVEKDSQGTTSDILVAKAVAKTVALVTSNEADSSEACLTKEQKLKAERLKRAKMFSALIKSGGGHGITEFPKSASAVNGSLEASNAVSIRSGAEFDIVVKEREGSSVPVDAEVSHGTETEERYSMNESDREQRRSSKRHLTESRDHELSDEDRSYSRKKHRSHDSSRHNRKHHHRHRKDDSSSRNRESRRHKDHFSSEEEHVRTSRSRHRHKSVDLSEVEDSKRSDSHRRRHHSRSEKKREAEARSKASDNGATDVYLGSSIHNHEVETTAADARPTDGTGAPSDLRAKIRAMLLETM